MQKIITGYIIFTRSSTYILIYDRLSKTYLKCPKETVSRKMNKNNPIDAL